MFNGKYKNICQIFFFIILKIIFLKFHLICTNYFLYSYHNCIHCSPFNNYCSSVPHYFYPPLNRCYWWKKNVQHLVAISTRFFFLSYRDSTPPPFKTSPRARAAYPFSPPILNFFYLLYIYTHGGLTPPSPSVSKRRQRHALRHNPHPPP